MIGVRTKVHIYLCKGQWCWRNMGITIAPTRAIVYAEYFCRKRNLRENRI